MSVQHQDKASQSIRGRHFSSADLALIKKLVEDHFEQGRTRASIEICKALGWRQPNGWLKDRACRDVLRMLEQRGELVLPPLKSNPAGNSKRRGASVCPLKNEIDSSELTLIDFDLIRIVQVKGTKDESLWNWLIGEYHYLGFSVLVGRALKYIAWYNDRIIGAWSISDCAWTLDSRDSLLKSLGFDLEVIRLRVVNNSRFLILPWVKVPNLASHLLSIVANSVKRDWPEFYSVRPLLLETFVETEIFSGTSYKAANWLLAGKSKGYKKVGKSHHNSQPSKSIFLYPLNRKLRAKLIAKLEEASCLT